MPKVPKVGKGVMDNTEFAKELEKTREGFAIKLQFTLNFRHFSSL